MQGGVYMSTPVSQFIPHSPPPSCARMSFHYIWISIPALQIGSSVLFFKIPHTCIIIQSLSPAWLFATPWTAAPQASQSFTISWSFLRLMLVESVMRPNCLILCCLLLHLLSSFSSIRIFSDESAFTSGGQSMDSFWWTVPDLWSPEKIGLWDQGPGFVTQSFCVAEALLEEASDIDIKRGTESTPLHGLIEALHTFTRPTPTTSVLR